MSLSKNEFLVLREIVLHPGCAQRKIVEATGLSLGSVNSAAKSLSAAGLIADGEPTEAGAAALEPYRVENAIILAAGLSSRFAPISYEKPKGLLKVRGEVLIERQIEQLLAAGITDITVVVGYKKEYFFYLEDKFGVSIVVNPDYASRNNSSSIKRVEDRLGNTYICSSDDYFTENPFEPYVWKAYYAVEYAEGPTAEWCVQTGAHDRITGVTIGGEDAWSARSTSIAPSLRPTCRCWTPFTIIRPRWTSCGSTFIWTTSSSWIWLPVATRPAPSSSSTAWTRCASSTRCSWRTSIPRSSITS